jgi:hypothetical protein
LLHALSLAVTGVLAEFGEVQPTCTVQAVYTIVQHRHLKALCVQVCLAALMAHVGAWLPAESFELTPVDAIFVRMGARDAIMSGQVRIIQKMPDRHLSLPQQLVL